MRPMLVLGIACLPAIAIAQHPPGEHNSPNVRVVSHVQLATSTDVKVEQELSRPYVYVSSGRTGGFVVVSVKDPARARVIYNWQIEDPELHQGGALSPMHLKTNGRYYFTQSFQFRQGGPDYDLGAVVFDVTGLPDSSKVKEVARIRTPDTPGGFHETFAYKHSDGRALLFATTVSQGASVFDIAKVVAGGPGLAGRIPLPVANPYGTGAPSPGVNELLARALPGYHDFYVGYDMATKRDLFYGAGATGYFVYDVSNLAEPKLVTSITGVAGVPFGHTFTPTPDGRYAVTEVEYQYAPLRIFDLKPGLDGQVKTISRPVGAWTPNWKNLPHNHEVRWPYVFVSSYKDGLQVFNMMDPTNPYTVGFYDMFDAPDDFGSQNAGVLGSMGGTFGVDVRNADGLIVASDSRFGLWALKMDGFDGWNGHQWGMPNQSSAQDWDNGPDGAPKQKVS